MVFPLYIHLPAKTTTSQSVSFSAASFRFEMRTILASSDKYISSRGGVDGSFWYTETQVPVGETFTSRKKPLRFPASANRRRDVYLLIYFFLLRIRVFA